MVSCIYKKLLWFIITGLFFSFTCCKDNIVSSSNSNEGLCIYATKININSDLSYQNIDLEKAELIGEPIISYNHIILYDTSNHVLTLSFSQDSLKKRIAQMSAYDNVIGMYGMPFIVTLDHEKIYGGWFWLPVSSIHCHSIVILLDTVSYALKINEIKIQLGYTDENQFKGTDPRNNRKIIYRLIKDKKVK
ncbi:hypothetical protein ACSSWA_14805 [Melioribacter sp. Ez-97]|uniref:hypothetical protein n=1 Tax=Melioribacter sp. Ez-97 TaxID=3423434 RepID=UPI003ED90B16